MARMIDVEPILMRWNTESLGRKEMYDMAKNAPAIDIVRCRDCKHWLKGDGSCFPHADWNDFCSNGERRDDELQEDNGRS